MGGNWTSSGVMTFFFYIGNPRFFFLRSMTLNLTHHLKRFAIPDLESSNLTCHTLYARFFLVQSGVKIKPVASETYPFRPGVANLRLFKPLVEAPFRGKQ